MPVLHPTKTSPPPSSSQNLYSSSKMAQTPPPPAPPPSQAAQQSSTQKPLDASAIASSSSSSSAAVPAAPSAVNGGAAAAATAAAAAESHQVGQRQATRSRTRTRQAGPSAPRPGMPRYNSEDHPLSPHKLAERGFHTFTCLGVPFHVHKRYTFLRELGIGAYGCVALARDEVLGCNVAIKKVTRVFEKDVLARRALREVAVLRHIGLCDNVTALLDFDTAFIDFNEIYLMLEASEADLSQIIRSGQALSDAHLQYFIAQILRGTRYMHSANIIHRDLKPGNLLVNADCQLKLCDFGLARAFGQRHSPSSVDRTASPNGQGSPRPYDRIPESPEVQEHEEQQQQQPDDAPPLHQLSDRPSRLRMTKLDFPGGPLTEYVATRWYRAPEIMLCFKRGYGCEIDVWSVGCILAELLGGKPIFAGKDYVDQIARINNVLGSPKDSTIAKVGSERAKTYVQSLPRMPAVPLAKMYPNANPEAVDLLSKMLTWDPDERITADEALHHPWLKQYHRSNANWTPPPPFSRFAEVELIDSIGEFRHALERESDEMRLELAALEAEERRELEEEEARRRGLRPQHERDEGAEAVHEDDEGEDSRANASSNASTGHQSSTRAPGPSSSPYNSPYVTPTSLATSTDGCSPAYETDLTSASAPLSVAGSFASSSSKRKGPVAGLEALSAANKISGGSGGQEQQKALVESLDAMALSEQNARDEEIRATRSGFRRRALSNAPSRPLSLRKAGSATDLRCLAENSTIPTQALASASDSSKARGSDVIRRPGLQREDVSGVVDQTTSLLDWLDVVSWRKWASRQSSCGGDEGSDQTIGRHGGSTAGTASETEAGEPPL